MTEGPRNPLEEITGYHETTHSMKRSVAGSRVYFTIHLSQPASTLEIVDFASPYVLTKFLFHSCRWAAVLPNISSSRGGGFWLWKEYRVFVRWLGG